MDPMNQDEFRLRALEIVNQGFMNIMMQGMMDGAVKAQAFMSFARTVEAVMGDRRPPVLRDTIKDMISPPPIFPEPTIPTFPDRSFLNPSGAPGA